MKIYTRTGDDGDTSLFGGQRVGKDDQRVDAYGTIDELNAQLGVVRATLAAASWDVLALDRMLSSVQHHLFDLGAELATPEPDAKGASLLTPDHVAELEQAIDNFEELVEPLRQFILPGGTAASAELHLARCICRRAERLMVALSRSVSLRILTIHYVNRLSDLLFVMARVANALAKTPDVAWNKPS